MRGKGKKKAKDPLAPKMPLSSYLEFARDERSQVLAELGPLSIGEVGKELGKRWKNLTAELKDKYDQKGRENRERFGIAMDEYRSKKKETERNPSAVEAGQTFDQTTAQSLSSPPHSSPPPSSPPDSSISAVSFSTPTGPKPEELGFAKQKGYSFHPALKTGELANGARIKVTYFGSGQSGTVDSAKWVKFSDKVEEKVCSPRLMKDPAFRNGLDQLKILLLKINNPEEEVTGPRISFTVQHRERRLRKLNKDGLQREEEENSRLMKEKMVERDGSPNKWGCRDCQWTGKYSHKAKAHARVCGMRRKSQTKKQDQSKYECSGDNCGLSFPYISQLHEHYR